MNQQDTIFLIKVNFIKQEALLYETLLYNLVFLF